jgi:hypothetical protein
MSSLKSWIKNFLIKFAVSILRRFDQGFSVKPVSSNATANRVASTASGSTEYIQNTTLVVNEDGVISNLDTAALLMKAIFETEFLSARMQAIFKQVTSQKKVWASHQEFAEDLFAKLEISADSKSDHALDDAKLYHQLKVHLAKTSESRNAYRTEGKKNPGGVFWPSPVDPKNPSSLFGMLPWAKTHNFIDQKTPIGSAGSCFAVEIAHKLQSEGYHYVITEPHLNAKNSYSNSCARWGIIFNTPSFRQLVERAFAVKPLPNLVWSRATATGVEYLDPYREDIAFADLTAYEIDQEQHVRAAREALMKAKVFVLTLGVNEVWKLKSDGSVFSRAPWRIASSLVERTVMSVEDNVKELEAMLNVWRKFNPEIQLVISVSPVPLHATFRGEDHHVVSANALSKSTLRVAAETFVKRNTGVYYFPSYETVMYCTQNAWEPDQRHVSREAVSNVMKLFSKMFLSSGSGEI